MGRDFAIFRGRADGTGQASFMRKDNLIFVHSPPLLPARQKSLTGG
jgi:hypothetical protein